ncbi:MAG: PQQ-dependent sugar dehydrogenase, partial [Sphingomonadales bacterium]|nr:PQQ-dependent sugar dehydrogenase [Sphingomonadales bacterium]
IGADGPTIIDRRTVYEGFSTFTVTQIANFDFPWSMAFLPDGRMLLTQKKGAMILFDPRSGERRTLTGTPEVVSTNQGGLMDVALAPDFARSRKIYFSYSEAGEGKTSGVVLASAVLDEAAGALHHVRVLFRSQPFVERASSYSGRIALAPDGKHIFFTNGERVQIAHAQDPRTTLGKVLRLDLDGRPARGNPLARRSFHPAIWTYGHRNLTGLAFDSRGRLWEAEMGPAGGDEVNLIRPGRNFGWPLASNGTNYDGSDIPDPRSGDGFEPPSVYWTPSLSPGSLAYHDGRLFPAWKDSLFVTGLSGMALVRIALDGETATKADHWPMGMRLRNVRIGPDGAIWLLEDAGKGRMLQLTPK